uniref:BET bromodomain protein n=1 Tax=Pithovirus LCPAC103 TaxID=2506588 RepID=A0A481Z3E1_9VIRU|nr:MAG: BET bromodomain protein [Pithovirus LCPAC103]
MIKMTESPFFPPYNLLVIQDTPIHPEWGGICRTIPGLPKKQKEDIGKLVMEHWRLSLMKRMPMVDAINTMKSSGIPYAGKSAAGGKGTTLTVNKLPSELQLVIARYVIKNTI